MLTRLHTRLLVITTASITVLTEDGVGFDAVCVGEPATGGGATVFVLTEDGVGFVVDEPETGGGATVFVLTEDGVEFDAVCVGDCLLTPLLLINPIAIALASCGFLPLRMASAYFALAFIII